MSKTLFFFLFSKTIDTYVNVIAYANEEFQIQRVVLIHILQSQDVKTALTNEEAEKIRLGILEQLEMLSQDQYIRFDQNANREDSRDLKISRDSRLYSRIRNEVSGYGVEHVNYSNLKHDLRRVFQANAGKNPQNYIVDFTTITKMPIFDILPICLALEVEQLYVFELRDPPTYDETSLFHHLRDNPKEFKDKNGQSITLERYSFTRITDRPTLQSGQKAFVPKSQLRYWVMFSSSVVLILILAIIVLGGLDSPVLSFMGLLSALIGIVSPLFPMLKT
ncbi:MAG: hypothetical protein L0154_26205 [Chloroflexi bacterium]|nr:hypothetical protein [Chloroflexota bacterium]